MLSENRENAAIKENVAEVSPNPGFETFASEASQYLMGIHDREARLFGIRYVQYLESLHRSTGTARRPNSFNPAQFLVRLELKKIFERRFGTPRRGVL